MPEPDRPAFAGFQLPHYTQVPDDLFSVLLPDLTGAEIKMLLVIVRHTMGYKRDADVISVETIADEAGISRRAVISASRSLEKRGAITIERRKTTAGHIDHSRFALRWSDTAQGIKATTAPISVQKLHGHGENIAPTTVQKVHRDSAEIAPTTVL